MSRLDGSQETISHLRKTYQTLEDSWHVQNFMLMLPLSIEYITIDTQDSENVETPFILIVQYFQTILL